MNNPRILILVLSYNVEPFSSLMKTQQASWDSVEVEGVETMYYHGGFDPKNIMTEHYSEMVSGGSSWSQWAFKCTDKYYFMAAKFKKALEWIKDDEYDYIFRTNSSSYVNKKALLEFAKTLPTEKLYAGWEIKGNEGFNIVSGAGFFLSRDTAKILMENIDPVFEKEEDYYCAKILHEHGIEIIDDKSRYDYTGGVLQQLSIKTLQPYHIRFKTDSREQDIENMKIIHKLITE